MGMDVGGTKSAGVLATLEGEVLATQLGGPGNYQAIGLDAAARVYAEVLQPLMQVVERGGHHLEASAFGLCGLDRPIDAERLSDRYPPLWHRVMGHQVRCGDSDVERDGVQERHHPLQQVDARV